MSKVKAETELDKAGKQFDAFEEQINDLTLDRMNEAPKLDVEPQTKMSQVDIEKAKQTYLKPKRAIASREKFDEKWRKRYEFDKEYVQFIAENKEIIGESIDLWSKPYPGCPAEEWIVPTNKPVWAPRYVAEQIKKKSYHRLTMQDRPVGADYAGQYTGQMVVDSTIQRLDAYPVSTRKSIFMGSTNF
jgi:hypothetical protein